MKISAGQTSVLALVDQAKQALCSAILEQNPTAEESAQKAWTAALEALRLATRLTEVLGDAPEATTHPDADAFRATFDEEAEQKALLEDLSHTPIRETLAWYKNHRDRIEKVQRPDLRNALYDVLRDTNRAVR